MLLLLVLAILVDELHAQRVREIVVETVINAHARIEERLYALDARVRAVEGRPSVGVAGAQAVSLMEKIGCMPPGGLPDGLGPIAWPTPTPPEPKDAKCEFCRGPRDAGSLIEVRFGVNGKVFCKACDRLLGTSAAVDVREAKELPDVMVDLAQNFMDKMGEPASSASEGVPSYAVTRALEGLVAYVEKIECRHEETHRGGVIWTICDGCDRKWADDRGGFVPYEEPEELVAAYRALAQRAKDGGA